MNYNKIYENLIQRGKNRILDGYTESHHIVPRCMGGGDDKSNLVDLTPEEHYVAHQLLVKIHPGNYALIKGANMMVANRLTNKSYGWIRRLLSKAMSESQSGEGNSQHGTIWINNPILQQSKKISIQSVIPLGWKKGRVIDWNKESDVDECPVCKKLKNSVRKFCSYSCSATYRNTTKETIFDKYLDDMIVDYKNGMSVYKCLISRNLCGTGANHTKLSKIVKTIGA
jgi:hypothetical protein